LLESHKHLLTVKTEPLKDKQNMFISLTFSNTQTRKTSTFKWTSHVEPMKG